MKQTNTFRKRLAIGLLPMTVLLAFAVPGFAQSAPFTLVEHQERMISADDFGKIEAAAPTKSSGDALLLTESMDSLVVRTGPGNDMLSYRIQGLRNPTLVLRAGTAVHILFANVDDDMPHDLRFGGLPPDTAGTVGTTRQPYSENEMYSAEDIVIRANTPGYYPYFCSYRDHAAKGMRGWIVVTSSTATEQAMINAAGEIENAGGSSAGAMNMSGVLTTEPMSQEGSGTTWVPAATPEYMRMYQAGDWSLMLHGDLFPRFDYQGGPRGGHRIDAPNWGMLMAERAVGTEGQFTAHLMMSLDPLTIGGQGYPLLLQTGETWHGVKLHDAQHPHDLFSELSVAYSQKLADNSSAYVYVGYPGEPALGPPVFMHRSSAMSNPNAPISHHWMDATHITFGVLTAGVAVGSWKLEGSYFNGSEPDENRYDFDPIKLNSYSGRLSFNPTDNFALQISSGLIKNPEGDGINVIRSTASAIYTEQFGDENWWSTTAAWGQNHEVNSLTFNALLLESEYNWPDWSVYGRGEYVQKTNGELVLPLADSNAVNNVDEVTLGLTRKLFSAASIDVDLGVQGSINFVPPALDPFYSEHPAGYEIYLSIHPSFGSMSMKGAAE